MDLVHEEGLHPGLLLLRNSSSDVLIISISFESAEYETMLEPVSCFGDTAVEQSSPGYLIPKVLDT